MPANKPETDGFIAGIEAKIAALQTLADSYRAALSLGAMGQPGELNVPQSAPLPAVGSRSAEGAVIELPTGAFRDKSITAAIRVYLKAAQRKQTLKEIATALKDGGLESTAKNFERTVNSTLHRLRESGELLQFKDKWDLASSYPEDLRTRINQKDGKSKQRPTQRSPRAHVERRKANTTQKRRRAAEKPEKGLQARVESYLRMAQDNAATWATMATALEVNAGALRMTLGRMVKAGTLMRRPDGTYSSTGIRQEPHLRAV